MVEIKCRTISEPEETTRRVFRKRSGDKSSTDEPFMQGKYGGELDYVCGNCTNLLAHNVSRDEISTGIVFQCPKCQAYNEA
jgi:DNA-directed RNA polymerase subunit RPC12/RpoP